MRRHIPLITVFVCQALLAALALLLHFRAKPGLVAALEGFDGRFPWTTHLALVPWFLPALPVVAIACDAIGLALPKRSARNALFGAGLILPAFGLVIAVHGLFAPLFDVAPAR